jgi:hypothetical protein
VICEPLLTAWLTEELGLKPALTPPFPTVNIRREGPSIRPNHRAYHKMEGKKAINVARIMVDPSQGSILAA